MKPLLRNLLILATVTVLGIVANKVLPASSSKAPTAAAAHGEAHEEQQSATLNDAKLIAAGLEGDTVASAVLKETLSVNGVLQPNQEVVVQVTPRFPGVVRELRKRVGDSVTAGEVLARIESNQSLTSYDVKAPIAGTIIERTAALGEHVSEQKPTFVVADLSTVWADFAVPRRDLKRVKAGDSVIIDAEDGGEPLQAKLSYVSPVGTSETQSALARAVVANDGRLRPGLFITGRVVMAEKAVPIAIKLSALQTVDNRTVVFVRTGDKFEPRELELGQRDAERAEVIFGLTEGERYASKNSFVVKAEIAKGSASHEH
jgi:cobalt-zinc-cadmium efflux system membrane fusion protein